MVNSQIAILSLLIKNPEILPKLDLEPHEFTDDRLPLGRIYETVRKLITADITPEPLLIAERANIEFKVVEKIIAMAVPLENLDTYTEEIRANTIRNEIKKLGFKLSNLADESEITTTQLLHEVSIGANKIASKQSNKSKIAGAKINNVLAEYVARVEKDHDLPLSERGIITPFADFTNMFGAMPYGDYTVLAADTGVGKTALIGDIVLKALNDGKRVISFVLEMSEEQVAQRQISKLAKLTMRQLREMTFYSNYEQKARFFEAVKTLNKYDQYYMFGTDVNNVDEILRLVHEIILTAGKVDLITIDYLQLVHYEPFKHNRTLEVGFASQAFATLAKETNAHVITAAQLNRNLTNRSDMRPNKGDLKDSSYIEQSADVVMFIYRDDYYHNDSETPGIAEINIAKGRNIGTGMFKLYFDGPNTTFRNLAKAEQYIF